MSRLSKDNRVLFVEYQDSLLHIFKRRGSTFKSLRRRLREVSNNLFVYKPLVNLPFRYYNRQVNLLNQKFLIWQLKYLCRKLDFRKIILWIFEPTSFSLPGSLGEKVSIYHCIDFFKNEKDSLLRKKCIEEMEDRLSEKCGILLVSAETLLEDKKRLNLNIFLAPSAANESFLDTGIVSFAVSEEIKKIPGPRIGFVGTIDNRIDLELVNHIASDKDYSIVFIGNCVDARIEKQLKKMDNIYMLGWKGNNYLPGYIKSFNVCIIPYKVNDFTKGISSIKLYEYLAMGKPVVSTNFSNLEDLKGLIRISNTKEDFIRDISASLLENNEELTAERVAFAYKNSWQTRLRMVSELISRKL